MTTIATNTMTNAAPFGAFEIFEFTNKRTSFLGFIRTWLDARATRKELAKLTVSQLEDIGLSGAARF